MPGWPRFVVIVRDDAIAVKTEEGSRIAADELPNCRSTGQIGFLIFRLFMISIISRRIAHKFASRHHADQIRSPFWRLL